MVHLEESVITLKFAQRAKKIKNKVHANAVQSPAEMLLLIRQLRSENDKLKDLLKKGGTAILSSPDGDSTTEKPPKDESE